MSRCKRSERLARLLLSGLLGLGLSGCASSSLPAGVEFFSPVAVASEPADLAAGVNGVGLGAGESLAFDLGASQAMRWTMEGVGYPLELRAVLEDGDVVGPWLMPACTAAPCVLHDPGVAARWWIETRPG